MARTRHRTQLGVAQTHYYPSYSHRWPHSSRLRQKNRCLMSLDEEKSFLQQNEEKMYTSQHQNGREYVLGTNRSIRRYQDLDTITFIQFYRLHLQIQQKKDTRMCPTFQLEVSRILGRRGWEIKC